MILGDLEVDFENGAVHTNRDSHMLKELTTVSVRKPFLPVAVMFGGGLSAMAMAFQDILYLHELYLIGAGVTVAACAGLLVGRLKLRSRELMSGDELADAVWGTFPALNAKRREIVKAIAATRGARDA